MKDRSESQRLTANERVNAISRVFMTLGTGLLAATSARIYVNGDFDRVAFSWLFVVALLIFCGLKILSLLNGEKD